MDVDTSALAVASWSAETNVQCPPLWTKRTSHGYVRRFANDLDWTGFSRRSPLVVCLDLHNADQVRVQPPKQSPSAQIHRFARSRGDLLARCERIVARRVACGARLGSL